MLLNKKSEDTVVIGKRYAVRNVIRSDEYGEVCKAYDTVMLRTVRMTRLIAEDAPQEVGRAYELYRRREQFLQAYRTLSSLHSSSLPLIYTIQQEGMGAFAVYENVCAPSLGEMLRTEKRVSFETAKERLLPVTAALKLMHDLRLAGVAVQMDVMGRNFKNQFKFANRVGAAKTVIIGENELNEGKLQIKDMESGEQTEVPIENIVAELTK